MGPTWATCGISSQFAPNALPRLANVKSTDWQRPFHDTDLTGPNPCDRLRNASVRFEESLRSAMTSTANAEAGNVIVLKSHEFSPGIFDLCEHTLVVGMVRDLADVIFSKARLGWATPPLPPPGTGDEAAQMKWQQTWLARMCAGDLGEVQCWAQCAAAYVELEYDAVSSDYAGAVHQIATAVRQVPPLRKLTREIDMSQARRAALDRHFKGLVGNRAFLPIERNVKRIAASPLFTAETAAFIRSFPDNVHFQQKFSAGPDGGAAAPTVAEAAGVSRFDGVLKLAAARHTRQTMGKKNVSLPIWELAAPREILPFDTTNAWVTAAVRAGTPFIVGRSSCGAEHCILKEWVTVRWTAKVCDVRDRYQRMLCLFDSDVHEDLAFWQGALKKCGGSGIHAWAGIYPETPSGLREYGRAWIGAYASLGEGDFIQRICEGEYGDFDNVAVPTLIPRAGLTELVARFALFGKGKPLWTSALGGKTVLVIHPFIATIMCQLRVRDMIHSKSRGGQDGMMPRSTRFKFVKTFQSLGGATPHGSWTETLDATKRLIDAQGDFDVAVIAAGGYAMPLAHYVRSAKNASVVVGGGTTQLWFGIMGHRWSPHFRKWPPGWIYPLQEDMPAGFDLVDDHGNKSGKAGPYWAPSVEEAPASCPHKEG